jgi:quercetin 2,3-dioxygenase
MKTVIDRANTRGHADYGWLNTWHTFSFADYYNPQRIHFGALRVLNDDTVTPGMGFDTHPQKYGGDLDSFERLPEAWR